MQRRFGYSKAAIEAFFHAFFDVCEEEFNVTNPNICAPSPICPFPEVLCAGIGSWNQVLSLGEKIKDIGTETSYKVSHEGFAEEVGGQHLYPALHLVQRGHKVAIATVLGDDEHGDKIESDIRRVVEQADSEGGGGDLIAYFIERKGATRLSFVVTYGGTRTIFDYDGKEGVCWKLSPAEVAYWKNVKALYLGTYFPEFQESLLNDLGNVPLRFFESGTRGPKDAQGFKRVVDIARKCNYVIISSEFLLHLIGKVSLAENLDTKQCQTRVATDIKKEGKLLISGFNTLWESGGGVLAVVCGSGGAALASRTGDSVSVKAVDVTTVPKGSGLNWLGCGDIFRGEFIHQIVSGKTKDPVRAAQAAAAVVAKKIQRKSFLEKPVGG